MGARENEQRVDQSVGFDQSTVQVDAERHENCRAGFCVRLDLRQP
jgi:hypothetical protein